MQRTFYNAIKRLLSLLAFFSLLSSHASTATDTLDSKLRPFKAEFTAFRSGNDVGRASLSLQSIDEQQYILEYSSRVSRFFLSDKRHETTIFSVDEGKLIPETYEYKRSGTGPNKALSVNFSAESRKIIVDDKAAIDWQGEFDNQLFRIDLPRKFAQGETSLVYDFVNYRGEKRQYTMQVLSSDNLSLPYGQLTAYKVKIDRKSNSRVTFAWFAPSLGHNLVRLQQFKDGKEQGDIQLTTFIYE